MIYFYSACRELINFTHKIDSKPAFKLVHTSLGTSELYTKIVVAIVLFYTENLIRIFLRSLGQLVVLCVSELLNTLNQPVKTGQNQPKRIHKFQWILGSSNSLEQKVELFMGFAIPVLCFSCQLVFSSFFWPSFNSYEYFHLGLYRHLSNSHYDRNFLYLLQYFLVSSSKFVFAKINY